MLIIKKNGATWGDSPFLNGQKSMGFSGLKFHPEISGVTLWQANIAMENHHFQ